MTKSTYLSIITLNVNGLSTPIKRHKVTEWIKKQDPPIWCLEETQYKHMKVEREGMEKHLSCKWKWK